MLLFLTIINNLGNLYQEIIDNCEAIIKCPEISDTLAAPSNLRRRQATPTLSNEKLCISKSHNFVQNSYFNTSGMAEGKKIWGYQ